MGQIHLTISLTTFDNKKIHLCHYHKSHSQEIGLFLVKIYHNFNKFMYMTYNNLKKYTWKFGKIHLTIKSIHLCIYQKCWPADFVFISREMFASLRGNFPISHKIFKIFGPNFPASSTACKYHRLRDEEIDENGVYSIKL